MNAGEYARMRRYVGTQKEVAARLGVHEMTLSKRERGEVEVDLEAVIAMRAIYDMEKTLNRYVECAGCGRPWKLKDLEAVPPDAWMCTRCAARWQENHELEERRKKSGSQKRFTDEQVRDLRTRYADGASIYGLAKEQGITQPAMRKILTGESYGKVPGAVELRPKGKA